MNQLHTVDGRVEAFQLRSLTMSLLASSPVILMDAEGNEIPVLSAEVRQRGGGGPPMLLFHCGVSPVQRVAPSNNGMVVSTYPAKRVAGAREKAPPNAGDEHG